MRVFLSIVLAIYAFSLSAQLFVNPDLEGEVILDEASAISSGWTNVPTTFYDILATEADISNTMDLTGLIGPKPEIGMLGHPYSGESFVSGLFGLSLAHAEYYHEGMQQNAFGFTADSVFYVSFFQAVVRQENYNDPSGSWSVYRGDDLLAVTEPTLSTIPYDDPNLQWERRVVEFQAAAAIQLFRFLPTDDDDDVSVGGNLTNGIRMGIDSLSVHPKCHFDFQIAESNTIVLCENDTIVLRSNQEDLLVHWYDDTFADTNIVTSPGRYSAVTWKGECMAYAEVTVVNEIENQLDIADQYDQDCVLPPLYLIAPSLGTPTWSDGSQEQVFQVTEPGTYTLAVQSGECIQTDTFTVEFPPFYDFEPVGDTTLCAGESLSFQLDYENTTYTWNGEPTGGDFEIVSPGPIVSD